MDRLWSERRIIGDVDTRRAGPLLICTAGLHGNEPAGGIALQRILREIAGARPLRRGRVLALTGNIMALDAQRRFVDEDLNRIWTEDRCERLRASRFATRSSEEKELSALLPIIEHAIDQAPGEVCHIDLHSTSGPGVPFGCAMDASLHPAFFTSFELPLIVGLRPQFEGTLIDWLARRGHASIGVEGGQHDDRVTVDAHEAVMRVALDALGMRGIDADPRLQEALELLRERCAGVPRILEIRHRHVVTEDSEFEMLPGFANFDLVESDQAIARDRDGVIQARESGYLLFPRYQAEGEDGFFLARAT